MFVQIPWLSCWRLMYSLPPPLSLSQEWRTSLQCRHIHIGLIERSRELLSASTLGRNDPAGWLRGGRRGERMGVNASSYPHSCSPRFGGNPQTQQTFIGKLSFGCYYRDICLLLVQQLLWSIMIEKVWQPFIFFSLQMAYVRPKFSESLQYDFFLFFIYCRKGNHSQRLHLWLEYIIILHCFFVKKAKTKTKNNVHVQRHFNSMEK